MRGEWVERDLKTKGSRRTLYLPQSILKEIAARGNQNSEYITTYKGLPWVPDTITEKWKEVRPESMLDWHSTICGINRLDFLARRDAI